MPDKKNRRAEDMLCPVLQVVNNSIYVVGVPAMRQLEMQLHRCDASPIPGDTNGNYCASAACRRRAECIIALRPLQPEARGELLGNG